MTENSLVIHSMQDVVTAAKAMATSGYFQDAKDMAQAAVKIMAGHEMGFGAFASMAGVHIINGKPAIGSNLIAAAIKKHPMYNYRVRKHTDTECIIEFFEMFGGKWELAGESSFSMADAQTAGLTNNPTWKKFPRNMVFSRAISNGARWYCPDVFGGAPTYTPEELGAVEDEDGYVTVMPEPVEEQPAEPKPVEYPEWASEVVNSKGVKYIALDTETLSRMYRSIEKSEPSEENETKKRAITAIMTARNQ